MRIVLTARSAMCETQDETQDEGQNEGQEDYEAPGRDADSDELDY